MTTQPRQLIRKKALLKKFGDISESTFSRRFRWLEGFPQPINTPDGMLAWFEDEIDSWLDSLGRTEVPGGNLSPLPRHWRSNRSRKPSGSATTTRNSG